MIYAAKICAAYGLEPCLEVRCLSAFWHGICKINWHFISREIPHHSNIDPQPMTLQELTNTYKNLVRRIDNGQMKEAFDLLTHFITVTGQHAFTSRVEELQNTYKYMLH